MATRPDLGVSNFLDPVPLKLSLRCDGVRVGCRVGLGLVGCGVGWSCFQLMLPMPCGWVAVVPCSVSGRGVW